MIVNTIPQSKDKLILKIKHFKKIGAFNIKNKVSIAGSNIHDLSIRNGKYYAYQIDDNLMIAHISNGVLNKEIVSKWIWTYTNKQLNVKNQIFGFYDSEIIKQIRKNNIDIVVPNTRNFGKIFNTNCFPKVELEMENEFGVASYTHGGNGFFDCYFKDADKAILIGGNTSLLAKDNKKTIVKNKPICFKMNKPQKLLNPQEQPQELTQ